MAALGSPTLSKGRSWLRRVLSKIILSEANNIVSNEHLNIKDLNIKLIILVFVHLALNFCVYKTLKGFNIKSGIFKALYPDNNKMILRNAFYFIIIFFIISMLLYSFLGSNGLQITNFLFSFVIIFELCLKVADSKIFINWLSDLDRSFRLLVMFIIGLNFEYFFTRLTYQIIISQ